MANRRLARINGISKEQCMQLGKFDICFCKDVLLKNILELMNIGFSYSESISLLRTVSKNVAPKPYKVVELLEKHHQWFLSTNLKLLDKCLRGGLTSGTITEITGPPGCGKTQFCMMLSSLTAMREILKKKNDNESGSVVYIDTENAFAAKRLENLEETIISNNVKLIIVDSIASLARKEFGGHNLITERNNMLMKEATLLKYYAETFNIPVLVTNQVTTSTSSDFKRDSSLIAALGNTWAHAVNTRLMVRYTSDNDVRELLVAKSPLCPLSTFYYRVGVEGIIPVQ